MGGNPWDLGTALGVDLLDLSTEDPNEERSAIRSLGSSILKGVLTEDKKKAHHSLPMWSNSRGR